MKTLKISFLSIALTFLSIGVFAQKGKLLEVSFDYTRQQGPGSNQYAVWIENDKGDVVRTLYVTSFTTKGRARNGQTPARGYTYRPTCVPTWVKHVNADNQKDKQIDAYTGATPNSNGRQLFVWDFKNHYSKYVPAGTYKIYVEATYINDAIVTYCGTFTTTDNGDVTFTTSFTKPNITDHRDMIQNVKFEIKNR